MSDIIKHNINSIDIGQRTGDGYVNLTKMVKAYNSENAGGRKQVNHYLNNKVTKEFLQFLSEELKFPIFASDDDNNQVDPGIPGSTSHPCQLTPLLHVQKGGATTEQGTWAHPKVAIHFAQWCCPKFAVMVTNWVFDWMNSGQTPDITALPEPEPKPLPESSTNEECDFADRLQQLKELVALGDRLGLEDSDRLMLKRRWRELIHLPNGEREISIAERAEELGYKPTPIELIRIGQIASSFYRDRHGAAPEKRKQYCGNVERSVNVYRHGDLIVIDAAIEAVMGKKR